MAKISLTEAVNIVSIIKSRMKELYNLIEENSTANFAKGDERPQVTDEVDKMVAEIVGLEADLIALSTAMEAVNSRICVDFSIDGKMLTISEAITRAQLLRNRLNSLKKLATKSAKPVFQSGYRSEGSYEVATFDVEKYKGIVANLEKAVTRLSLSIDKANSTTEIEFANVAKYLG